MVIAALMLQMKHFFRLMLDCIWRLIKYGPIAYGCAALIGLITMAVLFGLVPLARAQPTVLTPVGQQTPNAMTPDNTAFPLVLTNGQSVTITGGSTNSLAKAVRQDHGMSVFATVTSTNAASVGQYLYFDVTGDGTAYTANHPFAFYVPSNFVGTNTYWTNWPATSFNNFRKVQFTGASNSITGTAGAAGSNTNTVTLKLSYSQSTAYP